MIFTETSQLNAQFWRLPCFNQYAAEFLSHQSVEAIADICSRIPRAPSVSPEAITKLLAEDPGFRHYFRSFWLPLGTADLRRCIPDSVEWRILDVAQPSGWSNFLCSDSPFVCAEPSTFLRFNSPFAFPLSASRLLVSRRRTAARDAYDPIFSTKIATLSFCQATRYVAGTSREFMAQVLDFSAAYSDDSAVSRLREEVLTHLG